jgi:hypothetical protein
VVERVMETNLRGRDWTSSSMVVEGEKNFETGVARRYTNKQAKR